jgi:hypothetical protein
MSDQNLEIRFCVAFRFKKAGYSIFGVYIGNEREVYL